MSSEPTRTPSSRGSATDVESANNGKERHMADKPRRRWIATFNSGSPFLIPMGTGSIVLVLVNFPYPASWLHDLAYFFWVLDILLFAALVPFTVLAAVLDSARASSTYPDFPQAALLGPIPIAFDTVIMGLVSFYGHRPGAVWTAFGLYWIAVVMTLASVAAAVTAMHRKRHVLGKMTGAWLVAFIPPIVTAATGAHLAVLPPADTPLPMSLVSALLLTSFLLLALGLTFCLLLVPLYIKRLLTASLPPAAAMASTFVPAGPLGMGAYAAHALSRALAQYLAATSFAPLLPPGGPPPAVDSLSEAQTAAINTMAAATCIRWLGVVEALFLLGPGAGFLLHALGACTARPPPRGAGVALWACVFPVGVWANAAARLGLDLGSEGLKGVGAAAGVLALGLWAACAAATGSTVLRACGRTRSKRPAQG